MILESNEINFDLNSNGTINFTHDNKNYFTITDAQLDNIRPGEAGYAASLYTIDDEGDEECVGLVTWEITNHETENADESCDWNVFTINID